MESGAETGKLPFWGGGGLWTCNVLDDSPQRRGEQAEQTSVTRSPKASHPGAGKECQGEGQQPDPKGQWAGQGEGGGARGAGGQLGGPGLLGGVEVKRGNRGRSGLRTGEGLKWCL